MASGGRKSIGDLAALQPGNPVALKSLSNARFVRSNGWTREEHVPAYDRVVVVNTACNIEHDRARLHDSRAAPHFMHNSGV